MKFSQKRKFPRSEKWFGSAIITNENMLLMRLWTRIGICVLWCSFLRFTTLSGQEIDNVVYQEKKLVFCISMLIVG